jgi:hypothetical protein
MIARKSKADHTSSHDSTEHLEEQRQSVRAYRQRVRQWLIWLADRTPMNQRPWFRISEIANTCACIPGSVELDQAKLDRAIEFLRNSILTGEFDDPHGRSRVANLHPSSSAELRFARDSAGVPEYFPPLAPYLWIRRADCEAWFARKAIEFPKAWMRNNNQRDLRQGLAEASSRSPRYPLAENPTQPATAYAYYVLLERWGREGPPRSMSIRQITDDANEHRKSLPANKDYPATPGGLSESTVRRALGLTK